MNIKQIEKKLKHSLKDKISINKNTVFKYLMCGLVGLSLSGISYSDYVTRPSDPGYEKYLGKIRTNDYNEFTFTDKKQDPEKGIDYENINFSNPKNFNYREASNPHLGYREDRPLKFNPLIMDGVEDGDGYTYYSNKTGPKKINFYDILKKDENDAVLSLRTGKILEKGQFGVFNSDSDVNLGGSLLISGKGIKLKKIKIIDDLYNSTRDAVSVELEKDFSDLSLSNINKEGENKIIELARRAVTNNTNNNIDVNEIIKNLDITEIANKLNGGNLNNTNGKLVTDNEVKNYLENNYYNKNAIDGKLDTKLNKTGNNANEMEKTEFRNNFNLYSKNDVNKMIQEAQFGNINLGTIKINENDNGKITGLSNISLKDIDFKDKNWKSTAATQGQVIESHNILENKIVNIEKESNLGIANVAAIANTPNLIADDKQFALSIGMGMHQGAKAYAVALNGKTADTDLIYKLSFAFNDEKQTTFGAGIGYQFGKTKMKKIEENYSEITKELFEENTNLKNSNEMLLKSNEELTKAVLNLNKRLSKLENK